MWHLPLCAGYIREGTVHSKKLGALWPKIGGTWPKIEGTFGADGAAMALSAAPLYQSLRKPQEEYASSRAASPRKEVYFAREKIRL